MEKGAGSSAAECPQPDHPTKRNFLRAFGLLGIASLVLGTVAIFAAIGFLLFLWIGSHDAIQGRPVPRFWQTIVEPAWTARAVTLSSVVLRSAISLQAGLAAAMMAALVLETGGVRLGSFPRMSLLRAVHAGPQHVAWLALTDLRAASAHPQVMLIFVALASMVATQFSSTILLLDFTDRSVVFGVRNISLAYGFNSTGSSPVSSGGTGNTLWRARPRDFPRFAEYSEDAESGDDFQDTGATFRALLPLQSAENRTALRYYFGPATVVNSRVSCVQPSVQLRSTTVMGILGDMHYILGTARAARNHSMVFSLKDGASDNDPLSAEGVNFNCTMEWDQPRQGYWQLALCSIRGLDQFNSSLLDTFGGVLAHPYLLFNKTENANLSTSAWFPDYPRQNTTSFAGWEGSRSGPWAKWSSPKSSAALSITMCFIASASEDYLIAATADTDSVEPVATSDKTSKDLITTDVRRLFGAVPGPPLSLQERGVLRMTVPKNWTDALPSVDKYGSGSTSGFVWYATYDGFFTHNSFVSTPDLGVILTPTTIYAGAAIHRTHCALFQDIIQSGGPVGNPAKAMQTLYTVLMQMAYYDFLPQFDVAVPANISMATVANIPSLWKGFVTVAVLTGVHLIVVAVIAVLFLWRTERSLLGNSWQAVAQAMTERTLPVLATSAEWTDLEVERSLAASGVGQVAEGVPRRH